MSLLLPKRLARKTVYQSEWVNLYLDRVELPSGRIIEEYHFLDYPKDAVVMLLVNDKDEICLLKVRRYTTQILGWEIPAGGIEKGEDQLESAKREVLEETGCTVDSLKMVHEFHASHGMSNHTLFVYAGRVKEAKTTPLDTDEIHSVHWKTKAEIRDLIAKNEIPDGISLVPLMLYLNGIFEV